MEILNMNQAADHHILVFQIDFWKHKSDLSRMSENVLLRFITCNCGNWK